MPEPGSIEEAQFVRARPNDKSEQPMLEVLRVYCLGMLKACSYVNDRIQSEHFYEVWLHCESQIFTHYRLLTRYCRRKTLYQTHITAR